MHFQLSDAPQLKRFAKQLRGEDAPATLDRRAFLKFSGAAGATGFALGVFPAAAQQAEKAAPAGPKPTHMPAGFISIAKDGTVTVVCNRMDMGQGIETGLAMIAAEELDCDWSKVKSAFGTEDGRYVDPMMGMHLTGGSNSVKNSYTQYRELGARTKAMLVAAASKKLGVAPANLKVENGVISGGGKKATFGELAADAMKQPVPEQVALKDPKDFKIIGKPTTLLVSKAKSSGTQQYAIDVKRPGMLTAVIAQPPTFGGKVKSFDAKAAQGMKGVKAIYQVALDGGSQGVAVVADTFFHAKQARDALKVEWEAAGAQVDSAKQLAEYRALAKTPGKLKFNDDVSKIASAPKKLEAEFVFPYLAHAAMEPLSCTVDLRKDRCEVWSASQMPGVDAGAIAKVAGLKPEQVRINVQMSGGGFGRRAVPTAEWHIEALNVAKGLLATGKPAPVKVVWTREDDMQAGYYRPMHVHRATIGYDDAGNILGWDHVIVGQSIVTGSPFESFLVKDGIDGTITEGMKDPYNVPMRLGIHHPKQNVPVLWWRSVGSTHTAYAMETLLDELAVATKQDPVALRKKLIDAKKHPRHIAALDLAVEKSGYGKTQLPAGRAFGVAVHESFESVVAFVVEASVDKDGVPKLHKVTAGVHCNLPVNPRAIEAQVQGSALMGLGTCMPGEAITLKNGVVEQANFNAYNVPRISDMPEVAVHIVPSADPPKGIGEPGLPPLAPAFANAIARITGKRLRSMPFDLKTA
jgi:isoquinoline 1-oxidoreductase beta subunit